MRTLRIYWTRSWLRHGTNPQKYEKKLMQTDFPEDTGLEAAKDQIYRQNGSIADRDTSPQTFAEIGAHVIFDTDKRPPRKIS